MPIHFSANLSMLFTEAAFLDRFYLARQAGFTAVEVQFPYDAGLPAVLSAIERHGLRLVLFNLPPGDPSAGEWGLLSSPARQDAFHRDFNLALEYAQALSCPAVNLMFGQRIPEINLQAQIDCAVENLAWAAAQGTHVRLLIEPLNPVDFPRYGLQSTAAALAILDEVSHPQVMLQYDLYHAWMSGEDVLGSLPACLPRTGHIQLADAPGRHQPGTGQIPFPAIFAALEELGYPGKIGLEYRPEGSTLDSLAWLPSPARGMDEAGYRPSPGSMGVNPRE